MKRIVPLFLAALALVGTLAWTLDASAQSKADEAKARYLKGVELHDEGDYQSALIEFRRSYELVPNFNVLYNIGQEYFQLADYANALKTFQQYMDEGGRRIPPNRKEQVERDLDKLRSRVATVNVKVNVAGAELKVDDQLVQTPIPGVVMVSAGRRRIEVSKPGYRAQTRTEELAGQEVKEMVFDLQPEATVIGQGGGNNKSPIVIIGDRPVNQEEGPPIAPIVTWSLTGGLAVACGVFGGLAISNQSKLDEMKREPGHTEDELDDAGSSTRTMAILSDVFLAATVVGAGISIYFTIDAFALSSTPEKKPAPGPAPQPQPVGRVGFGPGSVTASVIW